MGPTGSNRILRGMYLGLLLGVTPALPVRYWAHLQPGGILWLLLSPAVRFFSGWGPSAHFHSSALTRPEYDIAKARSRPPFCSRREIGEPLPPRFPRLQDSLGDYQAPPAVSASLGAIEFLILDPPGVSVNSGCWWAEPPGPELRSPATSYIGAQTTPPHSSFSAVVTFLFFIQVSIVHRGLDPIIHRQCKVLGRQVA